MDGAAPGTTLRSLQAQVLDPMGIETAILTCDYAVDSIRNPDAAAALASAVNDWLVAEWLDRDPRLRAALVVPIGQPAMAAVEVHRLGGHPGFVAAHLPVRSAMPYGNRGWWPLFDAITEHDLVAQLHFGGSPGLPPTASGWPSTWIEEHVDMASAFQSQLLSLVAEGTFDRYPGLRVALLEAGFAWLPAFLWRADKGWRGLRREVPWLTAGAVGLRPRARARRPAAGRRTAGRGAARPGRRPARCAGDAHVRHRLAPPAPRRPRVGARRAPRRCDPVRERPDPLQAAVIVDCDIHNAPVSETALHAYLPEAWRRRRSAGGRLAPEVEASRETLGDRSYLGSEYPRATPRAARTDAWPPDGSPPASNLPFLREQLLDRYDVEYGVLTPMLGAGEQLDLESGAALASAINDWQAAEWLDPEPRLRASINVAYEDGELSAREIGRCADDPRFVQVLMLIRTAEPLGRRKYWPLYRAAAERGLPVGVHYGGWGRGPLTGTGFPSFYLEDQVGMATAFQDQLTSLVFEGVFEEIPELRIVLIEGGVAWLAPLMWRMDRAFELLGSEAPKLDRRPSEVIREHVWLTTQPMDEPERTADLPVLFDHMGMDDRICFATDYPHWDFDSPERAIPRALGEDRRRRIMRDNAHALYRLGDG